LWPSISHDLNALDYHLWGYVKDAVYQEALTTRLDVIESEELVSDNTFFLIGRINHRSLLVRYHINFDNFKTADPN